MSYSFFLPRSRQTDGKVTHSSPAASLCLGTTGVGPEGAGVPKTVHPGVRRPPFGAQAASRLVLHGEAGGPGATAVAYAADF